MADAATDALIAQVMEITMCSRDTAAAAVTASSSNIELAIEIALTGETAPPVAPQRTKLVCLVRQDLGMGVGKIAAQVSHAAVGAYKLIDQKAKGGRAADADIFNAWEAAGEPTIVLAVSSLAQLEDLVSQAAASSLPVYKVADAGRTEVDAGTVTVAAVGAASVSAIDAVTGSLSLL